ncbi:hypothetical protein [Flavobacterium polysaccharolyticum]|uniref:Cytochrome b562 n=1 Tax=Flavobacterium polysaccharolyticum TaxID=3133148 RepID=A0ABU9NKH0_9FLAO
MKSLKFLPVLFFFLVVSNLSAQTTFEKWPAIKTFHGVMSQTFHPAEEGDLNPIKTRSEEMVQKADALSKEAIPAEFKTPAILASIKKLQAGAKDLDKLVKSKGSDEATLKSLTALHDVFHEIVGLCSEEKH